MPVRVRDLRLYPTRQGYLIFWWVSSLEQKVKPFYQTQTAWFSAFKAALSGMGQNSNGGQIMLQDLATSKDINLFEYTLTKNVTMKRTLQIQTVKHHQKHILGSQIRILSAKFIHWTRYSKCTLEHGISWLTRWFLSRVYQPDSSLFLICSHRILHLLYLMLAMSFMTSRFQLKGTTWCWKQLILSYERNLFWDFPSISGNFVKDISIIKIISESVESRFRSIVPVRYYLSLIYLKRIQQAPWKKFAIARHPYVPRSPISAL